MVVRAACLALAFFTAVLVIGAAATIRLDMPRAALIATQAGPRVAGDDSRAGMVSFVHAVLGRLNVRRAAIVGHSMGGGVAAEYAERYPNEVWALVLVDASGIPCTGPRSSLDAMAHHALLRPVLRWTLPRWMIGAGIRDTVADRSKATDEMIDRLYD